MPLVQHLSHADSAELPCTDAKDMQIEEFLVQNEECFRQQAPSEVLLCPHVARTYGHRARTPYRMNARGRTRAAGRRVPGCSGSCNGPCN